MSGARAPRAASPRIGRTGIEPARVPPPIDSDAPRAQRRFMAGTLVETLHPSGLTDRRSYRIAVALIFVVIAAALAVLATGFLTSLASALFFIPLIVPAALALLLFTIRRLRGSGWSVWWAITVVCPLQPFGQVFLVDAGWVDVRLVWPGLDLIPLVIGLFAPSRPEERRTI